MMNITNTVPIIQNNDSEAIATFLLPMHFLQHSEGGTQDSIISIDQNLLFKTLQGTVVLDTNQLLNVNGNIVLTTIPDQNVVNEEIVESPEIEVRQKTDIPIQGEKNPSKNPPNKKFPKVRFLNNKSNLDPKKLGRPKKDSIKPKNDELFKCKFCDKEFSNYRVLLRHEKSHINEKKFKCPSCRASYNIWSNYLLHLAVHNPEDPTCPKCRKKFQRIASLKAHIVHHEKAEDYYCEECDILFQSEAELSEHIKEHGQDKKVEALQCKQCQLAFASQTEFKKHMSEHSKMRNILQTSPRKKQKPRKTTASERKHTCPICSKAFQKRSQIDRHMLVHTGEKPYVCKVCNRGFSQKGSLQIHSTRHTGDRPHKCALCDARFSQKGNLRAHILKTHSVPSGDENMFSCTECSCVFKRLGTLNGHMTRFHPKEKNGDIKYIISQLTAMQGNMMVDNDILQQAIIKSDLPEIQNETNDEKLDETPTATYVTLSDCGIDGNMRRYVIKQRRAGDIRWHLCSFCPKEFKKPSDLVRHLRVHTREKPYVCKICYRSFAVKSTLTSHIKTHSKCTKVQCSYCYKFFSCWTSLNAHILKHTGPKYKCTVCNKTYRTTGKLNNHFQIHLNNHSMYYKESNSNMILLQPIQITQKGLQPVLSVRKRPLTEAGCKSRPYHCKICGAAFRKLSHLKQHHVKHTGERPFRCHLCYRNFSSNSILKTHILTHTGSKLYRCVICMKTFSTNGSLKRHLESHSSVKPYLCPYCFKDFKTLKQCRKHMQTHNVELNLQIETDDVANRNLLDDASEFTHPPDLVDSLMDEPLPFSFVQNQVEDSGKGEQIDKMEESTPKILEKFVLTDEMEKQTPEIAQTLKADDNGTVVLPDLANQEKLTEANIQEIEDTLNSQMLNIIGNENFDDSSTYINKINTEPIPTTDELVNTLAGNDTEKPIEDNPFLYHQVIVNLNSEAEQLPIFDNGIDNILSQVKLQNDSLFLADLNSLNINNINETNNVLLPFQISQQDLPTNQLIMLPPEIEEIQNNLENIDQNLHLKLNEINGLLDTTQNISEANLVLNTSEIEPPSEFLNTTEEEIVNDAEIEKIVISDVVEVATEKVDLTCNACKIDFQSKEELKLHPCLSYVSHDVAKKSSSDVVNQINDEMTKEIFDELLAQQKEKDALTNKKPAPVYKNSCNFCPKTFRKPSDLQRHLRTHTGERPFKCDECAKSFSLKSTLESHSKVHQGIKDFPCHVCNCLFATKGSLSVHMRLHTGVKPFKCPLCQLKFRTSGHRKAHLTVHFKEALRTGKVPSEIVTRKAKMSGLMEGVENMMELSEKDEIPEKSQPVANNIVMQSDEKPLMHFEIQTNPEGHIINIKPTASNILFVDEASKEEVVSTHIEFDDKIKSQIEDLLQEKKAKQKEAKKRSKKICTVCHKEFGTKYLLDRHSKIHSGEKIFSCNYCSRTFNQKNAQQAHIRTHLGSRPYCCPYCLNTFSQSGNLKTHIKRIHGENQNRDTENSGIITNILETDTLA